MFGLLLFPRFHQERFCEVYYFFQGYWTAELGGLNQVVHIWEYGRSLIIRRYLVEKLLCGLTNVHWSNTDYSLKKQV